MLLKGSMLYILDHKKTLPMFNRNIKGDNKLINGRKQCNAENNMKEFYKQS